MFHYWHEEADSGFALGVVALAMNANPCLDERTDEPGPDGSLVVNTVALSHTAFIPRRIALGSRIESFRRELRELGYVEGRNIAVEVRSADDMLDRLPVLIGSGISRSILENRNSLSSALVRQSSLRYALTSDRDMKWARKRLPAMTARTV